MKINIFNIHFEVCQVMLSYSELFADKTVMEKHEFAEQMSVEFLHSISQKQIQENPKDYIPEVEFDVNNDDLFEMIEQFIISKLQPPVNSREQ